MKFYIALLLIRLDNLVLQSFVTEYYNYRNVSIQLA